jgi:hypothetical protein
MKHWLYNHWPTQAGWTSLFEFNRAIVLVQWCRKKTDMFDYSVGFPGQLLTLNPKLLK